MDFDAGSLIASMVVSSVGFVLFMYGRKMGRAPHIVFGLALLIYPYFVPGVFLMLGIAVILCGLLWFLVQRGM
jgi:hypothetical protein